MDMLSSKIVVPSVVFRLAEFANLVVVGAVVGVVDEIQENGPRLVEDLRSLLSEEFIGVRFEVVLVDRMEPVSGGIVTESVVRLGNLFSDGRLADSSTGDDRPYIAAIEGPPLDP